MLLAVVFTLATASQAQNSIKFPLITGDTVANTGTLAKVITTTSGYSGTAIQVNIAKLSGTGAGTVGIYGSLDGVNYVQIGTNYTITNVATQSCNFYVAAPLPQFTKVLITGAGTESIVPTVIYRITKYQTN